MKGIEEFAPNTPASLIVFDKQYLRLPHPAWVYACALFPAFSWLKGSFLRLWWHWVRNIRQMLAESGVDAIGVPNRIDHIIQLAV